VFKLVVPYWTRDGFQRVQQALADRVIVACLSPIADMLGTQAV